MTAQICCLTEDDALACASGSGGDARRDWEAHLDICAECRQLVSLLAAQLMPSDAEGLSLASGSLAVGLAVGMSDQAPVAGEVGGDDDAPVAAERPRFVPGQRIGRFELVRPIGSGGMGVVFEARDAELGRRVAVKLLRLGERAHRHAAEERLMRESRALAQLSHPNVVTLYEAGRHGDEIFLAMELVDGSTITEWLAARPRWRAIVDAFLQAGRGLAAAHDAGLIHRDVKPENMLRGRDGRVRIGDFGVVRHDRSGSSDAELEPQDPIDGRGTPAGSAAEWQRGSIDGDSRKTRPGTLIGTPRYMAPEIRTGGPASRRSDQWSFAASLWVALGGELAPLVEPRVPRWIRAVIARGLAREPSARWPSIDALLRALEGRPRRALRVGGAAIAIAAVGVMTGHLLAAPPVDDPCGGVASGLIGVWDPPRAIAMAHALLATGKPDAAWVETMARQTLDARAHGWLTLQTAACERGDAPGPQSGAASGLQTECLNRQLSGMRATVDGIIADRAVKPQSALDAVQDLPHAERCASLERLAKGEPLPIDPVRRQSLIALSTELDRADTRWRLTEDASVLAIAQAAARAAADYAPLRARALELIALIQRAALDPALFDTAHDGIAAAAEAGDDVTQARLGVLLLYAGVMLAPRPAREVDWMVQDADSRISAIARVAPETAERLRYEFLIVRAQVSNSRHQIDDCITDMHMAMMIGARLFGLDSWRLARARTVLVSGLIRAARFHEALTEIEPTIPIVKRALGTHNQTYAQQLYTYASPLYFLGDLARARAIALEAHDIAEHYATPTIRLRIEEELGDIESGMGDFDAAIERYTAELALMDQSVPTAGNAIRVRTRLGCARKARDARGAPDGGPSDARGLVYDPGRKRALLDAASCFIDELRPLPAVALLSLAVPAASGAPTELDIRLRFALARGLRDRQQDGDEARAATEADRARRDAAQLANPGLAKEIADWQAFRH